MSPTQIAAIAALNERLYSTCIDRHGPSHSCPFCERPLLLYPKKGDWPKAPGSHKPNYGQKRLKKEQARVPLFANDPDVVNTADFYEQRVDNAIRNMHEHWRHIRAVGWWRVIKWRARADRATREKLRARLEGRWLPHHPEVLLDIIFGLTGEQCQ